MARRNDGSPPSRCAANSSVIDAGRPFWHPRIVRRVAESRLREDLGPPPFAAGGLAQNQAMAGPLRRDDPAVADLHRLLDEMVEVLERIFEPLDFRQRAGHVHAEFEKGVAEGHRDTALGGKPADPHHVGHLAMNIQDVGRRRPRAAAACPSASRYSPELISVHGQLSRSRRRPVEIVAQDRVLDPEDVVAGAPDRLELDERLLGAPGLVGVDHDHAPGRTVLVRRAQPVQVPLEVGVPDLDLEGVGIRARRHARRAP